MRGVSGNIDINYLFCYKLSRKVEIRNLDSEQKAKIVESKINENEGLLPAIMAMGIFALIFFTGNFFSDASFGKNFFAASTIVCAACILWNVSSQLTEGLITKIFIKLSILIFSAVIVCLITLTTIGPFYMLIEGILLLIIAGMTTILIIDTRG